MSCKMKWVEFDTVMKLSKISVLKCQTSEPNYASFCLKGCRKKRNRGQKRVRNSHAYWPLPLPIFSVACSARFMQTNGLLNCLRVASCLSWMSWRPICLSVLAVLRVLLSHFPASSPTALFWLQRIYMMIWYMNRCHTINQRLHCPNAWFQTPSRAPLTSIS